MKTFSSFKKRYVKHIPLLVTLILALSSTESAYAASTLSQQAVTIVPNHEIIGYQSNKPIMGSFLNEQYRFYELVYGHPFTVSSFYEKAMVTKSKLLDQIVPSLAVQQGIHVTNNQIQQAYTQFETTLASQVYQGSLAQLHQTEKKLAINAFFLKKFVKDSILDSQFENTLGVTITKSEIQQYYNKHQSQFTYVTLNQIVVPTKRLAEKVLRLEKQGTPFESLALKYSTDSGSKYQGGLYRNVQASTLVQTVAQAAMRLPLGQVSEPLHSQYGYHIVRINARQTQTLASVAVSIGENLKTQQDQSKFNQYLATLAKEYPIRFLI